MTIKQANELILDQKHEEAYKLLLGIKPSFQVMITQDIGDGENATEESKVVSKEMKKIGLEGVAVIIYDGTSYPTNQEPFSYPNAVETELETRVTLIVVDTHDDISESIVTEYCNTYHAEDTGIGEHNGYGDFSLKVKNFVNGHILKNPDFDTDNCLLVVRDDYVLDYLSFDHDRSTIINIVESNYDTIFVSKQSPECPTLESIFTDLMNLPSEQYKHKLKVYEYESDQDPIYYSDTWMKIASEVDGIQKHLFEIERLLKPSSICEDYRSISDCSMLKKRFFAEAVYRNIVFIHVEFLPKANEPTNMKQKLFYQSCELVYKACSHFIVSIIDSADIMKVAGMKNEEEQRKNKVDILSLPPDAGMEYM